MHVNQCVPSFFHLDIHQSVFAVTASMPRPALSCYPIPEAPALPSPTPHVSSDPSINSSEFLHNDEEFYIIRLSLFIYLLMMTNELIVMFVEFGFATWHSWIK